MYTHTGVWYDIYVLCHFSAPEITQSQRKNRIEQSIQYERVDPLLPNARDITIEGRSTTNFQH